MIALVLAALGLAVGSGLLLFLGDGLRLTWQVYRRERCARRLAMPMQLSVQKREDFNAELFTLTLAHPHGRKLPAYSPGQYLTVFIETDTVVKRCYSLAAWQADPLRYELAIRKISGGQVSDWLHQNIETGSAIRVLAPRGEFTLQAPSGDVVLIAGGIGITPIRAMLHALLANASKIVLFYAARYVDDLIYHQEFIAAALKHPNFRYLPILSRPLPGWQGRCGRLDAQTVLKPLDNALQTDFYLCAASSMMDAIGTGLQQSGVMPEHIHFERFNPGALNSDDSAYRITLDGHETFEFKSAPTLLHGLEQQKIPVSSDCRAGHCGICRFKVLSGSVRWLLPKGAELAEDEILSCCVAPQSDLRLSKTNV